MARSHAQPASARLPRNWFAYPNPNPTLTLTLTLPLTLLLTLLLTLTRLLPSMLERGVTPAPGDDRLG